MFPRIKSYKANGKDYEYLVISESCRNKNGTSTTRDMATIGNTKKIGKAEVEKLINGLARLFKIDTCKTANDIKVLESLEHGSIILWKHFWEQLGLGKIISKYISKEKSKVSIDVAKYVEMMVVSRNSNPLSKLATTRWKETTSYKYMNGYSDLNNEVEYYYRSMDYLLGSKEEIEFAIFEKLKNLFSINIKMTFYDITSTYFHSDQCSISELGYSRDSRSDLKQIVIGVVTSEEGYPIKHYVFTGNTKDESTVGQVIRDLKNKFHIEETTFVGDRGMITKLNLEHIIKKDFSYIMGVKFRQDEIMDMLFDDTSNLISNYESYKNLKIQERILNIKDFIIWKTANILKEASIKYETRDIEEFKKCILKLTNKSVIKEEGFSVLLKTLSANDSKTKRKLSHLINKYENKYDDIRRVVVCLNEERKQASKIN
ncbi:MAG: IS1634 family transposase [Victivallaceae bacterium]|nr:IS1634 family transposase [Victivallaceae bacterium]